MQYLLSEEEMQAIRDERVKLARIPCRGDLVEALSNVCKMVASTMIPTDRTALANRPYGDGSKSEHTKPLGCIHDTPRKAYGYCDRCPVQGICPLPKEYSK